MVMHSATATDTCKRNNDHTQPSDVSSVKRVVMVL
jgi:hypothetical protein